MLQLQRRCATQTEPAYSVSRSPSPRSLTLAPVWGSRQDQLSLSSLRGR